MENYTKIHKAPFDQTTFWMQSLYATHTQTISCLTIVIKLYRLNKHGPKEHAKWQNFNIIENLCMKDHILKKSLPSNDQPVGSRNEVVGNVLFVLYM